MSAPEPTDPRAPHSSTAAELARLNELADQTYVAWRTPEGALQVEVLERTAATVTIGRETHREIALVWDPHVSRLHAELQPRDRDWVVVDTNSTGGTFVADERLTGVRPLRAGDRIRVGNTILAFHAPIAEAAVRTLEAEQMARTPLTKAKKDVLVALCRPLIADLSADTTTNQQIAAELVISVDAVKKTLTFLYDAFEIDVAPKRRHMARKAIRLGVVRGIDYH